MELTGADNMEIEFRDHTYQIPMDIDLSSLSGGAIKALARFDYDFAGRGLMVEIVNFETSVEVDDLTELELEHLNRKLAIIIQEMVEDMMVEIREANRASNPARFNGVEYFSGLIRWTGAAFSYASEATIRNLIAQIGLSPNAGEDANPKAEKERNPLRLYKARSSGQDGIQFVVPTRSAEPKNKSEAIGGLLVC